MGGGQKFPPQSLTPTKCFNISAVDPYVHKEKLGMSQFTSFRYVFSHISKLAHANLIIAGVRQQLDFILC